MWPGDELIKIETPDSVDFIYFPTTKSHVGFSVKARHDARISLRTNLTDNSEAYEITLGGWGNSISAIKRLRMQPDVAEARTPNIMKEEEPCFFWMEWSCDGFLVVGHDERAAPFLFYCDDHPFPINYIGVSTAWGATGEWILDGCHMTAPAVRPYLLETSKFWMDYDPDVGFPRNAVTGHENGLHIGRSRHKHSVTPGGVRGNTCTISWGGQIIEKPRFQLLCGLDISWVKCCKGGIPLYALPVGETEDGMALFIGRIVHNGTAYIGKIQPNHQICYVPLNGQEATYEEYEVLVVNDYPPVECIGR